MGSRKILRQKYINKWTFNLKNTINTVVIKTYTGNNRLIKQQY